MFINDQWSFLELSDNFIDAVEYMESQLHFIIDQDAMIFF